MPWIRGPCRCGFGPHAWLYIPAPGETYPYPVYTIPYPAYTIPYPASSSFAPPAAMPYASYPYQMSPSDERAMLEEQLRLLEEELERIRRRLEELGR